MHQIRRSFRAIFYLSDRVKKRHPYLLEEQPRLQDGLPLEAFLPLEFRLARLQ